MANWYVSSVGWTAVTAWTSATYSVGALRRQTAPTVGNERVFRVSAISTGISGGSEPTWVLTNNGTTTDGGVTWTEIGGQESFQSPGSWTAPLARLANATALFASGDTIYVAANHAETQSTAISIQISVASASLCSVICVDQSGSGHVPPTAGDLRTTATVTTTSTSAITLGMGNGYWYGITFIAGSTASGAASISLGNSTFPMANRYDSCSFQIATTGVTNGITSGSSLNTGGYIEWNNTTVSFAAVGQNLSFRDTNFVWRNTASAVLGVTGSIAGLINDASTGTMTAYLEGIDFSNIAHTSIVKLTSIFGHQISMVNCKVNAATAICTSAGSRPGSRVDSIATDSGALIYRNERYTYSGTLTTDATIYAAAGASDGTTSFSWKVVSNSVTAWTQPFQAFDVAQWFTVVGAPAAKTVSFEAMVNGASLLTNAQLWGDFACFGNSSSTLETVTTSGLANILATAGNVSASSTNWTAGVTARANTHGYTIGDMMVPSTNSTRVFICTTTGTSLGSIPVGYATAVDGGSVTDNTAIFRAAVRMTVSTSITPQSSGLIKVIPKVGVASTTLWIDPFLTVV